jgi:hypothetical protein
MNYLQTIGAIVGYYLLPSLMQQAENVIDSLEEFRHWVRCSLHRTNKIDLTSVEDISDCVREDELTQTPDN